MLPVNILPLPFWQFLFSKKRTLCGFILLAVWIGAGCGEQKAPAPAPPVTMETAKLVTHVTSGIIAPDDPIRVRFATYMVKQNQVGASLRQPVFTFDPPIDGAARWTDRQTLEFQPNARLPLRRKFTGTLAMAALFPDSEAKPPEPLVFQFEVAGREIAEVTTDFQLADEDDPARAMVTGTIRFTEKIDRQTVATAAVLRMNGSPLRLDWSGDDRGEVFTFTSETFQRTDQPLRFQLSLPAAPLEISRDFEKTFSLPPLADLAVQSVRSQLDGERPNLIIEFSDELDPRRDLSGLIAVSPTVDFTWKTMGKKVYLSGNFEHGQTYTVTLHPGLRSRFGTQLKEQVTQTVTVEELKPQLKFASDGVFLPSANQRKVRFLTLNLRQVRIEIKRVFENNLGQFLQTEQLNSARTRNQDFNHSYVNRVGVSVYRDSLEIGETRNRWLQSELDLSRLIPQDDRGLYLIHIHFLHRDMLYGDPEAESERREHYYYGEDYYSNPFSPGYLYAHGNIYKPIILSDIGLTYKKAHDRHLVFATHLLTGLPWAGVRITLKTYQNQEIARAETDGAGRVEIPAGDEQVFFVDAEKDGQRSVLKLNETAWNLSTFDTEGAEDDTEGTRAFIYSERGVYRPGDEVNLSVIVRNEDGTFPENHPVTTKIYNPRNQKVYEQTNRTATDGFYNFSYRGTEEDPTGNYRVEVIAGSRTFHHTLRIETVVPFRLRVKIAPEKSPLTAADKTLNATLTGTYLFGNPAAGLNAEVLAILRTRSLNFPKYRGFVFENQTVDFRPVETYIFSGALDANGQARLSWQLPDPENAPGALSLQLNARIYEKGGRPNLGTVTIPVDPFERYVGVRLPEMKYGYAKVGATLQIPAILLTPSGEPVPGRALNYRIYRNERHWWWEFDSYDEFQLRFKSHTLTRQVEEGTLFSLGVPVNIALSPSDEGVYLIEVQDGESGHTAAVFVNAYAWGGGAGGADAGVLALKTDRERYRIGETATVSFPTPPQGRVLFSLEKGQRILETRWLEPDAGGEMKIPVEITREMGPTTYVAVSVIQPHNQTANDRPLRMYGVVPLNVEDPTTRQGLTLKMPDELRANQKFTVEVQTTDRQPTQFTIAVVDEGLLALTGFETPDAWQHFFQKQRLGVMTYDLFAQVMAANKGDVFRVFSIGGGLAEQYRQSQVEEGRKKRFEPVSMFRGPLKTDRNGRATVEFEMPNYVGAVRVMVVSAGEMRFGNAEKTVPVKTELMVLASLPRVLGPQDWFVIPATVFAMKETVKNVQVKLELEGPLTLLNGPTRSLTFAQPGEQDVFFRVQAAPAVGPARVRVTATSGQFHSVSETHIQVRASSPRVYASSTQSVDAGGKITLPVPDRGIPGSNEASLTISRRPNMNLGPRLAYLVRFPYGCLEQTTSAVFPQLYLKDFLQEVYRNRQKSRQALEKEIDENINFAIRKMRKYQLPSGGFAYWPGSRSVNEWSTNYAGHFLIEARRKGYSVPDDLFNGWLRFQASMAGNTRQHLMVRTYRAYLLALAGKADLGALNLLKESSLKDMKSTEKWLLAAAYLEAGVQNTAGEIARAAGFDVSDYWEFGNTYGSGLRDRAILLEMQVRFGNWAKADELAAEIGEALSQDHWYSTQTTGYCLLALGKYLDALEGMQKDPPRLAGTITLPDGTAIPFDTEERVFVLPLESGFGQSVAVEIGTATTAKRAFITLSWSGVPLISDVTTEEKNLSLRVEWLDEDGRRIDPASLKQGTTFWGHFTVGNPNRNYRSIEEVALVQVLPAGWEIENIRLSGENMPGWMSRYRLGREEYVDIRDDRIMWFFDLRYNRNLDFVVKLNAVTVGEFTLPHTRAEAMYNQTYQATRAGKTVAVQ